MTNPGKRIRQPDVTVEEFADWGAIHQADHIRSVKETGEEFLRAAHIGALHGVIEFAHRDPKEAFLKGVAHQEIDRRKAEREREWRQSEKRWMIGGFVVGGIVTFLGQIIIQAIFGAECP